MKLKLILILILSLVVITNFTYAQSKKIQVGYYQLKNLTNQKNLDNLSNLFFENLSYKFSGHQEIKLTSIGPVKTPLSINSVSKSAGNMDYIIFGEYKLVEKNVIQFKIDIIDIVNHKQFESIVFYMKTSEINSQQINQIIDNILWSIMGIPFQVHTKPTDCEVYINQEYIGRTPLKKLSGKEGKYKIVIYKQGYQKIEDEIILNKGKENTFLFHLKPHNLQKTKSKINIKYAYSFMNQDGVNVDPFFPFLFSFEYFYYNLSLEVELGIINFEKSVNTSNQYDTITMVPLTFHVKYHFFQDWSISPFIGLGAGIVFLNHNPLEKQSTNRIFFVDVGANLFSIPLSDNEFRSNSRLNFFVEGRYFNADYFNVRDENLNLSGFMLMGGISYVFF